MTKRDIMDMFDKVKRSKIMSSIRSKNTGPELLLRREIWRIGLRYRINFQMVGKPDIIFTAKKLAIFVDGCYWHKCPRHYRPSSTNSNYWQPKIAKNVQRDRLQEKQLKAQGWTVLRFWEHDIKKDAKKCAKTVSAIIQERDH